ncbi:hypothetical protein MmTuc01_2625 [Methanosarcina mazei Tuc01]|uniref:Uncharacterized protein n=1 Tax=Methanosarcina mazei Tuc01 TaxID=1236903 RepID=M1QCG6_METMZ|nr:hypothetical protein MmTuc01_2625 [Methanosarcina mazei Tuc01]
MKSRLKEKEDRKEMPPKLEKLPKIIILSSSPKIPALK